MSWHVAIIKTQIICKSEFYQEKYSNFQITNIDNKYGYQKVEGGIN